MSPPCGAHQSPLPERPEMTFCATDLPQIRRMTATCAAQAGMSAEAADDFVIAVNEIATNAVRHGSPEAWMALRIGDGSVIAEIRDTGRWPAGPLAARAPRPPGEGGGMGLEVARLVCDDMQIKPSPRGTAVLLRMTVR